MSADQPERYVWILRKPEYNATDGEGAKEQARGKKSLTNFVNGLKRDTYRIDMTEEISRHVTHLPGLPDMPEGAMIDMVPDTQALIEASNQAGLPPPQTARELQPGEVVDEETGKPRHFMDNAPPARAFAKPKPNPLAALGERMEQWSNKNRGSGR
jgi:hypothetical protein